MNVPDNYDLWVQHEQQQERQRSRLPVCDSCRRPIYEEHLYRIEGQALCEGCMIRMYREEVTLDE